MNFPTHRKKIFLGTKNPAKRAFYTSLVTEYEILTPTDLEIDLEVEENDVSLLENSQKKALEWAQASGLPTLSEDTGFFIHALGGKPGVSVKTWGGEVQEIPAGKMLEFVKGKCMPLEDTSAYFQTVLSLGFPDGTVTSITDTIDGYIDKDRFGSIPADGYPLSSVFIALGGGEKSFAEKTVEERKQLRQDFMGKIIALLREYDDIIG